MGHLNVSIQPLESVVAPMKGICAGSGVGETIARCVISIPTAGIGLVAWCMFA